jgi:hypothetical protein
MKRFSVYFASMLAITLALTFMGSGCGDKGAKKDSKPTPPPAKGDGSAATDKPGIPPGMKKIVKAGDGTITGKVVFEGEVPACVALKEIAAKPECISKDEHENCDQTWTVGKDKGVANVLVVIKAPKDVTFEASGKDASPAVMDQPHCAFLPHVVALRPGQKLQVKNSAKFAHNTKLMGNGLNNPAEQGTTIPPAGENDFSLKPQKQPLTVKCDVHPWMKAVVWSLDTPYFAVTGPDGSFKIENVPNGIQLEVEAWHEGRDFFYNKKVNLEPKKSISLDDIKVGPK